MEFEKGKLQKALMCAGLSFIYLMFPEARYGGHVGADEEADDIEQKLTLAER
jgi:hypothetical protein